MLLWCATQVHIAVLPVAHVMAVSRAVSQLRIWCLQEYMGSYVMTAAGKVEFCEGPLLTAMRRGQWLIADELNLAPSEILEAFNRSAALALSAWLPHACRPVFLPWHSMCGALKLCNPGHAHVLRALSHQKLLLSCCVWISCRVAVFPLHGCCTAHFEVRGSAVHAHVPSRSCCITPKTFVDVLAMQLSWLQTCPAPSSVPLTVRTIRALTCRLLDENRELYVPELQETVKPHPHFMLWGTQNPPGAYGGRKQLSRAFRTRFLELHVGEFPEGELAEILHKRCAIAPSYAAKMVAVMRDLERRRQASTMKQATWF